MDYTNPAPGRGVVGLVEDLLRLCPERGLRLDQTIWSLNSGARERKRSKAMASTRPRYSKEEFARRGEEIYERDVRPRLGAAQASQFVAIDIETGAYEVDADELAASDRLTARIPNAQIWLRRVGSPYARRFGPRRRSAAS